MAAVASPFCQTCTSNHKFYTAALADYLPEEHDREYAKALAQLPIFKRQLEDRYPLVCSNCADAVSNRLKSNNYIAKAETLGMRIKTQQELQGLRRNWVISAIWAIRGLLWISFTLLMMTFHFSRQTLAVENLCKRLYPWSFFVVFWDYKWYARQQAPSMKVTGKRNFLIVQIIHQLLRAYCIFSKQQHTSIGAGVSSIILTILALRCLRLCPTGTNITSTSTHLTADSRDLDTDTIADEALSLSLADNTKIRPSKESDANKSVYAVQFDPMDWQPTSSALPEVAAQRFFAPEPPTGLESLFSSSLSLTEDHVTSPSEADKRQRRRTIILVNATILALAWATFYTCH